MGNRMVGRQMTSRDPPWKVKS